MIIIGANNQIAVLTNMKSRAGLICLKLIRISCDLFIQGINILTYCVACSHILAFFKSIINYPAHTYNFIFSCDIRLSYHFLSTYSSLCGNISCCRNSSLGSNTISANQIFTFDRTGSCNCFARNCFFRCNIASAIDTASIDGTTSINILLNVNVIFHFTKFVCISLNLLFIGSDSVI